MLKEKIGELEKSEIKEIVENRLAEFSSFQKKSDEEWFSELCFCILTANSRAKTAINIQNQLTPKGFISESQENLVNVIKSNKHRFHNNKAKYIVLARSNLRIRQLAQDLVNREGEKQARNWIAENVKGIGYKEASHFLRNTGYQNLAILDRHIINLMVEQGIITKPKNLAKKNYFEIEDKFISLASSLNMSPAKLDLYMWYLKTGEVLK